MKYFLFAVLFSFIIFPIHAQEDYFEISPTDLGTLDVGIATVPEDPELGEMKLKIDFINPKTNKVQEHIDYKFTLQREGQVVFGPTPLIHTSEGKVTIPLEINEPGLYFAIVEIEGILFQPIPSEVASFTIPVAQAQSNGINSDIQNGGCLVATAAYGSELAPAVQNLREIRDNVVMQTNSGYSFMIAFNQIYYSFSPSIADLERENSIFKEIVKITITPLVASLSLLNFVEIESDVDMWIMGLGLISLNIGMYFGIPAVIIIRFHKKRVKSVN